MNISYIPRYKLSLVNVHSIVHRVHCPHSLLFFWRLPQQTSIVLVKIFLGFTLFFFKNQFPFHARRPRDQTSFDTKPKTKNLLKREKCRSLQGKWRWPDSWDVSGPADPDWGLDKPIARRATSRPKQSCSLLRHMKVHARVIQLMLCWLRELFIT